MDTSPLKLDQVSGRCFCLSPPFYIYSDSMTVFCSCREECFCGLSDLIAHPQRLGDMSMTWDWVSYEALTTCHKPVDPILWRNLQPKLDSVGLCHCGELNALFELATAVVLKLFLGGGGPQHKKCISHQLP